MAIGKDIQVNVKDIREAMLDQTLDQTESELEDTFGKEYLNPKPVLTPGTCSSNQFVFCIFLVLFRGLYKDYKLLLSEDRLSCGVC